MQIRQMKLLPEVGSVKPATVFPVLALGLWALQVIGLGIATIPGAKAQSPIIIQFSHVVTADTSKGKAALKFKELAEARTEGKVRVEVYPNSELYKDKEELEALRLGAVQMLAPALSKLGGDFEVFDLPFLFKDHAAFRSVVNGPIGQNMLQKLESRGMKGLGYWDNGFKVFTSNRPLQSVRDFKGLKIRVQASKVLVDQMQKLGAEPVVSPLIDVYKSLKDGRLDGEENTPINIDSQRLHEVQNNLTISNHGYLAYAVVVNKEFWERLPSDIRIALEGALRDATAYENELAEADNKKALEHMRKAGNLNVLALSPQEIKQWRDVLSPVYQDSRAWIDPALVTSVLAATSPP